MANAEIGSEPLLLTLPRAAKVMGVAKSTLERLLDDGDMEYIQLARFKTRYVEVAEIHRWIAEHRINAQTAPSQKAPPRTPALPRDSRQHQVRPKSSAA
ncbi:hypothetical protein BBK14_11460 [Parafrankia soli]|uniref:Helix-turn-helix domain-containing protein n=1 Tax=Parafrankia soli TaxID=2599596 RepID=A0A1S1R7S5_9ACTN|nr:helix-turn-helix domain-containing protein [Parafrankia soli]OHV42230.1 hypothetical protein BBK14_11460 [Parafrankia soli]